MGSPPVGRASLSWREESTSCIQPTFLVGISIRPRTLIGTRSPARGEQSGHGYFVPWVFRFPMRTLGLQIGCGRVRCFGCSTCLALNRAACRVVLWAQSRYAGHAGLREPPDRRGPSQSPCRPPLRALKTTPPLPAWLAPQSTRSSREHTLVFSNFSAR